MSGADERARLVALLGFAERRLERANTKSAAAICEVGDAVAGHVAATERLAAWDAANPSLIDLITHEGDEE